MKDALLLSFLLRIRLSRSHLDTSGLINNNGNNRRHIYTMDKQQAPFPLINRQAARLIRGRHTEVLVTSFVDKILILVSQYGKVGSLVLYIHLYTSNHRTGVNKPSRQ